MTAACRRQSCDSTWADPFRVSWLLWLFYLVKVCRSILSGFQMSKLHLKGMNWELWWIMMNYWLQWTIGIMRSSSVTRAFGLLGYLKKTRCAETGSFVQPGRDFGASNDGMAHAHVRVPSESKIHMGLQSCRRSIGSKKIWTQKMCRKLFEAKLNLS